MQRAKDFAEHLLGEIGAAAPLQIPVTTARATKLNGSSHDTFAGHPRHHQVVLTNLPPPPRAFVAGRWRKNTTSHLHRAFEDPPLVVTDKPVHQSGAANRHAKDQERVITDLNEAA